MTEIQSQRDTLNNLGLKVKNRRYGITAVTNWMTVKKKKKILKAAQKALNKQDKSHKKLMKIISFAFNRDYSHSDIIDFIKNVVKESKCRNKVKELQNYIKLYIEQDGNNSPYSILKPSEVKSIAEEILWINKKLKKLSY